jgi:hypothetical protein
LHHTGFGVDPGHDPGLQFVREPERAGESGKSAALDARTGHSRLVHQKGELGHLIDRAPGDADHRRQVPELAGVGVVPEDGDAVYD